MYLREEAIVFSRFLSAVSVLCFRSVMYSLRILTSIYLDLDHDDPTPTDPTQLHIIILQLPQIHCDIFNR